jgi:hypothetical protein
MGTPPASRGDCFVAGMLLFKDQPRSVPITGIRVAENSKTKLHPFFFSLGKVFGILLSIATGGLFALLAAAYHYRKSKEQRQNLDSPDTSAENKKSTEISLAWVNESIDGPFSIPKYMENDNIVKESYAIYGDKQREIKNQFPKEIYGGFNALAKKLNQKKP